MYKTMGQHILKALEDAKNRVDIVLLTGGLGPTKDDITKKTFLEYFQDTLVENPASAAKYKRHIFQIFTESSPALKSRTGHGSLKSHSASKPYRYRARDVA